MNDAQQALHELIRLPFRSPLDKIQTLLERIGSDRINDNDPVLRTFNTPLLWALRSRRLEVVQKLVEMGADVNYQNKDKGIDHPLIVCIRYSFPLDIVDFLLKKGANPHTITPHRHHQNYSPYQYAIDEQKPDIILTFINNGFRPLEYTRIPDMREGRQGQIRQMLINAGAIVPNMFPVSTQRRDVGIIQSLEPTNSNIEMQERLRLLENILQSQGNLQSQRRNLQSQIASVNVNVDDPSGVVHTNTKSNGNDPKQNGGTRRRRRTKKTRRQKKSRRVR